MKIMHNIFAIALLVLPCLASRDVLAGSPKLYWSDPNLKTISRSNLDGSQAETFISTGQDITYLAADEVKGKLIYTVGSPTPQLWSVDFDGSDRRLVATFDIHHYFRGLAVDPGWSRAYWTSSDGYVAGNGEIRSAYDTDGSGSDHVLDLTENYPSGMAIDPILGKIFWTNPSESTVEIANLDGSSRQAIWTDPVSFTASLTVDPVSQKLYWTDLSAQAIHWSNYDGSQAAVIGSISSLAYDSGITVDHASGFLFWSDPSTHSIYRSNLDGSSPTTIISSGLSYPMSLVVATPEPSSFCLLISAVAIGLGVRRIRLKRT